MRPTRLICLLALISGFVEISFGSYERPPPGKDVFLPQDEAGPTSPQQVHISLVGNDRMRISWITKEDAQPLVEFGTSPGVYKQSSTGTTTRYRYIFYKSGRIHEAVIGPLAPNTVYYYRCSGDACKEYSFKTPPAQLPIKFAVVGDLGQTVNARETLEHIAASNYDVMLLPGDLSYANMAQSKWDTFGQLVEPLASQRPWMVTTGDQDLETLPIIVREPFKAYNARWPMPYEQSNSPSNLYYSFDVAGVHVVMLCPYIDVRAGSDQYKWLQADLATVNRGNTPWLVVLLHTPWYNSNEAHEGDGESMRVAMEKLFYDAQVNVVLAGHVHAYERFGPVYNAVGNNCGPIHITIGDGGNHQSLATVFLEPKPEWSLFREASFGHGQLEVYNDTHAKWSWHRNNDPAPVVADNVWLTRPKDMGRCVLKS